MGRLAPGRHSEEGGTAVMERPDMHFPAPKEREEDWRDRVARFGRTCGILVRSTVEVAGDRISGDVEPRHDAAYKRCAIRLRRDRERILNANELEWVCSVEWPGPMVAFAVFDEAGKMIAKATIAAMEAQQGTIRVDEGVLSFRPFGS